MRDVQIITFDAGGTLLYPYPSVGAIYAEVMGAHGIHREPAALDAAFTRAWKAAARTPKRQVSAADEKSWWHALVQAVLRDLDYHGDTEAVFAELWVAFAQPGHWRLYEGALHTLRELRARGYRLAILSNWDLRLRPLLQDLDLAREFAHLVISSEVGAEKPDTRIFRYAEAVFAAPPGHFLHVGDSDHHDAGGAAAAGWRCLLVSHGEPASGRLSRLTELLDRLPPRPHPHSTAVNGPYPPP